MSAVTEALRAYRAAVDESRRADYAKQQAAQALYEARQAEDRPTNDLTDFGEPMPDDAFPATIAYVDEPTKDGRRIAPGAVDWAFSKRVPLTSGFEGGQIIGYVIPTHITDEGAVMATVYVEDRSMIEALGIGLDHVSWDPGEGECMTITAGRLRHVVAQPAESAAWPGVVVNREG